LNLTIKLTDIHYSGLTAASSSVQARPLLICDRCQDIEEIVVATMQIASLEQTLSLCGGCAYELPIGFNVA